VKTIIINGQEMPIRIVRSNKSSCLKLRVDSMDQCVKITAPIHSTLRDIYAFAVNHNDWIKKRLSELPLPIFFRNGTGVNIFGETRKIRSCPDARRGVWDDGEFINVSGMPENIGKRVENFLKEQAKQNISEKARFFAAQIDKKISRISIKDTKSRWGSCSVKNNLNFSWRIIFAPIEVYEYVIAHEVAHLKEHNHSAKFWKQVEAFTPHYKESDKWLRDNGKKLYRYRA